MESNYRRRKLTIRTDLNDITELEAFLDKICDDFHIYDDYYGNIIASMTAAYELIAKTSEKQEAVNIYFQSGPAGVKFSIHLGDHFLTLAAKLEKMNAIDSNSDMLQEPKGDDYKLLLLDRLSDGLRFKPDGELMEITFHITGINDKLSMQRTQLLHNYYRRLQKEKKTHH